MLAIDVSRSMTATGRAPDAARCGAQARQTPSSRRCRRTYSIARRRLRHARVRRACRRRPTACSPQDALDVPHAERGDGDRRRGPARGAARTAAARDRRHRAADVGAPHLRRRPRRRPDGAARRGAARARAAASPSRPCSSAPPNGIVTSKLVGGYQEQIRVPPSPGHAAGRSRSTSGGQFFRARTSAALNQVYKKLATRVGPQDAGPEVTDLFAGGAIVLLLAGGGALGALVPEASREAARRPRCRRRARRCAVGGRAGGRDERVPRAAGLRARRGPVGARDAGRRRVPARRARSATSSAASTPSSAAAGSTSASSARSAARSTPGSRRRARPSSSAGSSARRGVAPSFRPHIGCVPGAGGGRRTPTAYHAVPARQADDPPGVDDAGAVPAADDAARRPLPRRAAPRRATHAVAFYGDAAHGGDRSSGYA